jgi:hypothetical protein
MANLRISCAILCRSRALRVLAIAAALSGCGGAQVSSVDGGAQISPVDAPMTSPTGCPSYREIDTNAAVGNACAPDEAYCLNPTCDPCNKNCPAVRCVHGTWRPAVSTAICAAKPDASMSGDTGAPPDGGACVTIDPLSYDQTCSQDSSCIRVTPGTFCQDAPWCSCGFATINVEGQSRYEAALQDRSRLTPGPGGCHSCPYLGTPRCVAGRCTLCGGAGSANDGCPDGG